MRHFYRKTLVVFVLRELQGVSAISASVTSIRIGQHPNTDRWQRWQTPDSEFLRTIRRKNCCKHCQQSSLRQVVLDEDVDAEALLGGIERPAFAMGEQHSRRARFMACVLVIAASIMPESRKRRVGRELVADEDDVAGALSHAISSLRPPGRLHRTLTSRGPRAKLKSSISGSSSSSSNGLH